MDRLCWRDQTIFQSGACWKSKQCSDFKRENCCPVNWTVISSRGFFTLFSLGKSTPLNKGNHIGGVSATMLLKSDVWLIFEEYFYVLWDDSKLVLFLTDALDVSQYSLLFNKLLAACSEGKNLSISSAITEFMFAKNIPIEFHLLRALITTLGRSDLWVKARTCYKSKFSSVW